MAETRIIDAWAQLRGDQAVPEVQRQLERSGADDVLRNEDVAALVAAHSSHTVLLGTHHQQRASTFHVFGLS